MRTITLTMPCGLGDCHWVLQRMRAFRKWLEDQHGPVRLVAHIAHDEHHRSTQFVELTDFFDETVEDKDGMRGVADHLNPKFSTIAGSLGRDSRSGGAHLDYAFQANGHLERGLRIEAWLPELGELDYTYQVHLPAGALAMGGFSEEPRILLYPSGLGPNNYFKSYWTRDQWQAVVNLLNFHGLRPTFVGANTHDDMTYWQRLQLTGNFEDLVGKTNLHQYLALILNCRVWMGLNSGGGIIAGSQGRPTIMLWSDVTYGGRLHPNMATSWLPISQDWYRSFSYGKPGMEQAAADRLVEILR